MWKKYLGYGIGGYLVIMLLALGLAFFFGQSGTESDIAEEQFSRLLGSDRPSRAASGVLVPDYAPILGPSDAPITIVEFGDFQCPFCARSAPIMKRLLAEYPNEVRLVWRHFPIASIHPLANDLAHASMCAHEQGRFWQYHDRVFQIQSTLQRSSIETIAQDINLNIPQFRSCQASNKYENDIAQDFADIIALGGQGTPTWMVNGRLLQGALPLEIWRDIIEKAL